MRSRSWTTFFAEWNCASCRASSFRCLHHKWQSWNDKAVKTPTMLPPAFRSTFKTAMRSAMRRTVLPVGH